MSNEETEQIRQLRTEIHRALEEMPERRSWLEKNGSWVITVAVLAVTGLVRMVQLEARVDAHAQLPSHDAEKEVTLQLARIEVQLENLRKQFEVMEKKMTEGER